MANCHPLQFQQDNHKEHMGMKGYKHELLSTGKASNDINRSVQLAVAGADLLWEKNIVGWLVAGANLL